MGTGIDRDPSPRKRDLWTGGAAVLAHVAVLAIAWPFAAEQRTTEASATQGLIDLFIETPQTPRLPEPKPALTVTPEASSEPAAHGDGRAPGAARAAPRELPTSATSEPEREPAASASAATTATATATSEYDAPAPAVPMAGGGALPGTPGWSTPGVLPTGPDAPGAGPARGAEPLLPRAAIAPGKGATLLRDDMRAHDAELGIGTPGATAISNAVADAVRGSTVPNESSAVLVARIGGDGILVSIGVQRFNAGDTAGWNGVAQAALGAVGKKKLKIAGLGARGAIVQVNVRSAVTYPSGSKDGAKLEEITLDLLKKGPPRDVMPAPSPEGDSCAPEVWSEVKPLCGVGMKVGTFDLTDLATKKHRHVHATFQVKLLDDALALATPSAAAPAVSAAPSASATAAPASSVPK